MSPVKHLLCAGLRTYFCTFFIYLFNFQSHPRLPRQGPNLCTPPDSDPWAQSSAQETSLNGNWSPPVSPFPR